MAVTPRAAGDVLTAAIFNTKLEAPILLSELAAGPLCIVRHSVDQTAANLENQILSFDTEVRDPDGQHEGATNPSRITILVAGPYWLSCAVAFASSGAGFRAVTFAKNAGVVLGIKIAAAFVGEQTIISHGFWAELAVSDYVYVYAYQNSGGALAIPMRNGHTPQFAAKLGQP